MPAADNLINARRLSALGSGIMLPIDERSAHSIGVAIRAALEETAIRRKARVIADAIDTLPAEDEGATLIERLAVWHRATHPIMTPTTAGIPPWIFDYSL